MAYKITGTLTNCTSNPTIPYTFTSDLTTITFKANSGYTFETLKYTNSDGSGADKSSEAKGKTEYKTTVGFDNVDFTVIATKAIEPPPTEIPFTQDLKGCTSDLTGNTVKRTNQTKKVTFTAFNDYIFNTSVKVGEYIEYGKNKEVLRREDIITPSFLLDQSKISFNLTFLNETYSVKIICSAYGGFSEIDTTYNLTNCTSTPNTNLKTGSNTVRFKADDGYHFVNNGKVTYNLGTLKQEKSINITNEKEFNYDIFLNGASSNLVFNLVAEKETNIVGNFNNLYIANDKILNDISRMRFEQNGDYILTIIDYGEYISNIISIPFSIDTYNIGDNLNIVLGPKTTDIKADKLINNILNYEIGKISIPEKYKNNYDYDNVQCILYLPFTDSITIPVEYVIGKEISINYLINGFNGSVSLQLFSNNELCYSNSFEIGTEIPFIGYQGRTVIDKNKVNIDNGIRKAYIKVIRNIPILTGKGFETLENGELKDYNGYVECSDISLSINRGTKDELDTIKTLLRNGVVIND